MIQKANSRSKRLSHLNNQVQRKSGLFRGMRSSSKESVGSLCHKRGASAQSRLSAHAYMPSGTASYMTASAATTMKETAIAKVESSCSYAESETFIP